LSAAWTRKDLLAVADLSAAEVRLVLDTAEPFREVAGRAVKKVPTLRGKTVAVLDFGDGAADGGAGGSRGAAWGVARAAAAVERAAWELAARRLSADALTVPLAADAGAADVTAALDALAADLLVIRHPHAGVPAALARRVRAGVVNAGDGAHEDPVAGLAAAFTLRRRARKRDEAGAGDGAEPRVRRTDGGGEVGGEGYFAGMRVALVGDLVHSGAARSALHALVALGAEVVAGGLHALVPTGIEALGARRGESVDEAVEGAAAVVVVPPHPSTADGRAYPSAREYHRLAGLTAERLAKAQEGVIVLHAGPPQRGLSIAADVAEAAAEDLREQAADALALRMAVLYLLAGFREETP
jgi:aspartate carbamoyltransferase catalytic subunit